MKKTYSKPLLYAERFELVEHIASCAVATGVTTVTYRDRNSCSYQDGDIVLFNEAGENNCQNNYAPYLSGPDEFLDTMKGKDSGCYNAFSNGNVFAS